MGNILLTFKLISTKGHYFFDDPTLQLNFNFLTLFFELGVFFHHDLSDFLFLLGVFSDLSHI